MSQTTNLSLQSKITDIKGIGPKKAESFNRVGIFDIKDILDYYPRSYQDFRNPKNIADLKNDDKGLVVGRVLICNFGKGYGRKRTLHLLVEDNTGRMEVLFFMAGYMKSNFHIGDEFAFFGKVKVENNRVTMFHPEYSKYDEISERILPVYPLTRGLTQKDLRKVSELSCSLSNEIEETLPSSIIESANLCSNAFAYTNIHYPEDNNGYKAARYRLIYEELFDLKCALSLSTKDNEDSKSIVIKSLKAKEFLSSLKFTPTNAQLRVIDEIISDMHSQKHMNRLVQGDVGSGKTLVAEAALCEAVFAGYQGLFMAPTEILATQHYNNLKRDFEPFGINVELLTSSLSAKDRKAALERIKEGVSQIIVGTHALISSDVIYQNVGLVITDEQHRFGVSQRKKLSAKGENPDTLIMTATPIPRTLAVVLYADMDISIIDEMPKGRKAITTLSFNSKTRKDAYKLLFDEVAKGRQAYIVAPFIEDSEELDGRSAETLYEAFKKKHPEISVGLLHGELSDKDKEKVMMDFYNESISVLISTVVIEVGIDVPNATVMLIENSERFGLAQMHQLRGRVGRGEFESYCLICTEEETEISKERSKILCDSSDGFYIAEKDLEIRGPGEFFGYRQHGLPQLVLADPIKHKEIADKAGEDVKKILAKDPLLLAPENASLHKKIESKFLELSNLTI